MHYKPLSSLGSGLVLSLDTRSFSATVFVFFLVVLQWTAIVAFAPVLPQVASSAAYFFPVLGATTVLVFNLCDRLSKGGESVIDPSIMACLVLVVPVVWNLLSFSPAVLIAASVMVLTIGLGLLVMECLSKMRLTVSIVVCACGFAFVSFLLANALQNADVFSQPRALGGLLQIDTLYHAAMASMIMEHGVPSIGIDGVVPMRYHVLSHVWFGHLGQITGVDMLTAYVIGRQVVLLPLMVFGSLLLMQAVAGQREGQSEGESEGGSWTALASYLIVMALFSILDWNSYMVSESHIVGMILLFFAILSIHRRRCDLSGYLPILVIFLCIFLASAAKISSGFVLYLGVMFVLLVPARMSEIIAVSLEPLSGTTRTVAGMKQALRVVVAASRDVLKLGLPVMGEGLRRLGLAKVSLVVLLSVLLLIFVKRFILEGSQVDVTRFYPFYFFRFFKVAVLNFGVVAAALWLCLWQRPEAWNRPLCHLLAVIMLAGLVPALLFRIAYGNGYYFINISALLAVPVLAAWLAGRREWASPRLRVAAALAVLLAVPLHIVLSGSYRAYTRLQDRLETVLTGRSSAETHGPLNLDRLVRIADAARQTPLARMRDAIVGQRDRSLRQIVYLMPGVDDANPYACQLRPFFVPAITGLPRLMGRPDGQCDTGPHYGFVDYTLAPRVAEPVTDDKICAAAQLRSFAHVIVVDDPQRARRLACKG